jgi:hypothetical protein
MTKPGTTQRLGVRKHSHASQSPILWALSGAASISHESDSNIARYEKPTLRAESNTSIEAATEAARKSTKIGTSGPRIRER